MKKIAVDTIIGANFFLENFNAVQSYLSIFLKCKIVRSVDILLLSFTVKDACNMQKTLVSGTQSKNIKCIERMLLTLFEDIIPDICFTFQDQNIMKRLFIQHIAHDCSQYYCK